MDAANLDPDRASDHLNRLGVLLVRGNDAMRATVEEYKDALDRVGYWQQGIPRGGGLWQFQADTPFRFHMHEIMQRHFYPLLKRHFGAEVMLSATGTNSSVRTVSAQLSGLIPFHQDIAPVGVRKSLTFWFAIEPDSIGVEAPGLRFIASTTNRRRRRIDHRKHTDRDAYEIKSEALREDEFFWTPEFRAGDIVIFDPLVPHASFGTPDMSQPRTSVDIRVMPFTVEGAALYRSQPGFGAVLFDGDHMVWPSALADPDSMLFEYKADAEEGAVAEAWRLTAP